MDVVNWRTIRATDCEMSVRTRNSLNADFGPAITLGDLAAMTNAEILRSANLGRRGLKEIRDTIETLKGAYPDRAPEKIFLPSAEIDWALLGRAVEFYKALGYVYVEAPWAASEQSVAITCPNPQFTARVDHLGSLVGSAEQSLLHLVNNHYLPPVSAARPYYVACTPCFRLGDTEDGLHFPYFMKVELFTPATNILALFDFLKDAGECFRELGATVDMLSTDQTDQGVDININGIEVGSYGQRSHQNADGSTIDWTYGTGLALPRFSQALARTDDAS